MEKCFQIIIIIKQSLFKYQNNKLVIFTILNYIVLFTN